jgi:hypothetical protein
MNTKRQTRRLMASATLFVLPAVLVGCSSSGPRHAGDIDSIRWDPSPAMHTLAGRDSDRLNNYARAKDTNLRAFSEDFDRVFFLDRPSRLTNGVKR